MDHIDPALKAELQETLDRTEAQGTGAQAQAVAERFLMTEPSPPTTDLLWKTLIFGLIAILVIALVGIIYLSATEHSVDVVVTIFSSALTGLLGLFVAPQKNATK